VFAARLTPRIRSLPLGVLGTAALLVLTAAPASAQGTGGASAQMGDEQQPAVAAPGAAPQPTAAAPGVAPQLAVGGLSPGTPVVAPVDGAEAQITGVLAAPPAGAPPEVLAAIAAANSIAGLPYRWGGGHGDFDDTGYDCSGAVSRVLNAIGHLDSPLDSSALKRWGRRGRGQWITVYTNPGHAYIVVAGLRFDTSMTAGDGPGWSKVLRTNNGTFEKRHWPGL
jgi:cell wall-associated NlpC family hydrolase